MPVINPKDVSQCVDFITRHKDEIVKGTYDIQIQNDWVSLLKHAQLLLLAQHCPSSKAAIASATPAPDILEVLAEDANPDIRLKVTRNKAATESILRRLSKDDKAKSSVASHANCPLDVLIELASVEGSETRGFVASHPNTPPHVLAEIAKDPTDFARLRVALNTKTPTEVLEILSMDSHYHVRECVGKNPKTPENILRNLSEDPVDDVREGVASNPMAPKDILKKLSRDRTHRVAKAVEQNPNRPKLFVYLWGRTQ